MTRHSLQPILLIACILGIPTAAADWTDARCDIYPAGSDQLEKMVPCTFAQSQGYITITFEDGSRTELMPTGDLPGNYRDKDGQPVYRQSGLGKDGQIFRLPDRSIFVYWNTSALNPSDANNWSAPFSTRDYDATTQLRCKTAGQADFGWCPAGIARMENQQASITIESPTGSQFTINFMEGYVNATNHEVEAKQVGDTWSVLLDNGESYEVPIAAIEGG